VWKLASPKKLLRRREPRSARRWFDVKEGEASIFGPENGSYELVARVQMDEWSRIAAAAK
jgi:hypothetical protein